MSTETTAELERSASTVASYGFNARAVLAGTVDTITVRQAVDPQHTEASDEL
jgi:hypothetical protein